MIQHVCAWKCHNRSIKQNPLGPQSYPITILRDMTPPLHFRTPPPPLSIATNNSKGPRRQHKSWIIFRYSSQRSVILSHFLLMKKCTNLKWFFFWRVRKFVKTDYYICNFWPTVCPCVRPSAKKWIPAGRIFTKLGICVYFFRNYVEKIRFLSKSDKNNFTSRITLHQE